MSGTFSQIYIQIVFAVKGRENLIGNSWKTELHKYIAGIIKGKDQKSIIVNGPASGGTFGVSGMYISYRVQVPNTLYSREY